MGMTGVQSNFTQIISHICVILYRIPTKRGTEIRLNKPFKCTKFQLDRNTRLYFMADFAKCVKRRIIGRKKTKKKPKILTACISEMAGEIFFTFVCRLPYHAGTFGLNRTRDHGATYA